MKSNTIKMSKTEVNKLVRDTPSEKISVFTPLTKNTLKDAHKYAVLSLKKSSVCTLILIEQD